MRERWVQRGVKIAMIGVVAITVCGFVVMGLWNWLAPAIFGGRTIDFWQALGIIILSKILFGGFARTAGLRRPLEGPGEGAVGADDSRGARSIPPGDVGPLRPGARAGGGIRRARTRLRSSPVGRGTFGAHGCLLTG